MFLEKLTLNGFKSFAKPIEFTFQPGIVSIVGPNGSGKSNVADALRWVLGEQSMKNLRGKKSVDVIFSGSDKKGRMGMAEVSLYLNNEDNRMPVDYSEVIITRRLFQDGTSNYLLNNSETRLNDIQLLLAQSNFGQRTYSVIGQGMVDEVLSATPQERREFFEEAAGVKHFQIRRDKSVSKLAATWENLQTAQVQLSEISPRLRSLTRQVKRLERRTEVEKELHIAQYQYYGHTWHDVKKQLDERSARVGELASRRASLDRRVKDLQQQMASLTKESSHSERFEKLNSELQELMARKSALRERELSIKTEVALAEQEAARETVSREVVQTIAREVLELRGSWKELFENVARISTLEEFEAWKGSVQVEEQKWQRLAQELEPYVERRAGARSQDIQSIRSEITEVDGLIRDVQKRQSELAQFEKKERTKIWQLQNLLQNEQKLHNESVAMENEERVQFAKLETKLEDIEHELEQELSGEIKPQELPKNAPEDPGKLEDDMRKLKRQLELIGGIDPDVEKEYHETQERFDYLDAQVTDLKESLHQIEDVLKDLDSTIKERFDSSFERINKKFQVFFKQLFNGGSAKLVLVRQEKKTKQSEGVDLESEEGSGGEFVSAESQELKLISKYKKKDYVGVEIHATPPGKKLKGVSMLSGGERALVSIALICAIIANNPAPFVVLDEVDAALDEANSIRLSTILEQLSKKTQFIVITHNRATMEKAGILYGVTMGDDGTSQVLSLKLEEAAEHTNR